MSHEGSTERPASPEELKMNPRIKAIRATILWLQAQEKAIRVESASRESSPLFQTAHQLFNQGYRYYPPTEGLYTIKDRPSNRHFFEGKDGFELIVDEYHDLEKGAASHLEEQGVQVSKDSIGNVLMFLGELSDEEALEAQGNEWEEEED